MEYQEHPDDIYLSFLVARRNIVFFLSLSIDVHMNFDCCSKVYREIRVERHRRDSGFYYRTDILYTESTIDFQNLI